MVKHNIYDRLTQKGRNYYLFFLRFLKENKCFYQFQRAFLNYNRTDNIENFITQCNECNSSIIDFSFIWYNTNEGHEFWLNLNEKFKLLIQNLKLRKYYNKKNDIQ